MKPLVFKHYEKENIFPQFLMEKWYLCIFCCLRSFVPTFLSLQPTRKKTSGGDSKRLHLSNPLILQTILAFLNTDNVRYTVTDTLVLAPSFCHAHLSCFRSSSVAKTFSFSFAHQKKTPISPSPTLAHYNHA